MNSSSALFFTDCMDLFNFDIKSGDFQPIKVRSDVQEDALLKSIARRFSRIGSVRTKYKGMGNVSKVLKEHGISI